MGRWEILRREDGVEVGMVAAAVGLSRGLVARESSGVSEATGRGTASVVDVERAGSSATDSSTGSFATESTGSASDRSSDGSSGSETSTSNSDSSGRSTGRFRERSRERSSESERKKESEMTAEERLQAFVESLKRRDKLQAMERG